MLLVMLRRPAQACCCGSLLQLPVHVSASVLNRISARSTLRSYVKAVDWASPGGSASSKKQWSSEDECKTCRISDGTIDERVPNFGVVAALSRNRVIGVQGRLPWSLPEDRQHFEDLTRDKVLIIGRKTLDEGEDVSHIQHTKTCIVVSTTLEELDFARYDTDKLRLARSFRDALVLAGDITADKASDDHDFADHAIDCWVGGGERIFTEALKHPRCVEVKLTYVDLDIDFDPAQDVALFPRKYIWDRFFDERREGKLSAVGDAPSVDISM